jgi:alcohol dehydrogenase class IV
MKRITYRGYGSYRKLKKILKKYSPRKIFVVTGKKSFTSSKTGNLLMVDVAKYKYIRFFDFESNPQLKDIERGVGLFQREKCDFVLAIGGGSTIDMAKAITIFNSQQGSLEALITSRAALQKRKTRLIVIPTTAGTGSEATHFAVIYINKVKYSLAHKSLLPDVAILDPIFSLSMPAYLAACTGMDVLCQGIESLWSIKSTPQSRAFSKKAISLAMANIIKSVSVSDRKSRKAMLYASNYAGQAINIALTTASHAVSYPITSYFHIPHGHAVALTLPSFIEFNNNVSLKNLSDKRGVKFVKNRLAELYRIMKVANASEAKEKVIEVMDKIKLKYHLTELGINNQDVEIIIKNGFDPQRVKNNPRLVTPNDLRKILVNCL